MKMKIGVAVILLGAVGIGAAWAAGLFSDPEFEEAKQIQEEVQQSIKKAFEEDDFKPGERREQMEQFRETVEKLPETQQDVLGGEMRKFFMSQMERRIDEVLTLPPEQRTAALDRHIDQMEERRQAWERQRREREASERTAAATAASSDIASSSPARDSGGSSSASVAPASKNAAADQSAAQKTGKSSTGGGGRRFGPPGRDADPEQRDRFRRQMLDNTNPEQRAKFQEYRRLVDERRQERGLPEARRPF